MSTGRVEIRDLTKRFALGRRWPPGWRRASATGLLRALQRKRRVCVCLNRPRIGGAIWFGAVCRRS
jgi:hypothetical protein